MLRPCFPAIAFLVAAAAAGAQDAPTSGPTLLGRIDGATYTFATGAFRVPLPIVPGLNGSVRDTSKLVAFRDLFTYVNIVALPLGAAERSDLESEGLSAYLGHFFANSVLVEFVQAYPGTKVEKEARFYPSLLGGSLVTYVLLPGGSQFANQAETLTLERHPLVAKRGILLFAHNDALYVVSEELSERITEGTVYTLSPAEEDALLRDRLFAVANTIQFPPYAPARP
jgi:hypothetical protein